ncbi:hypothetical protein LCGC14_1422350 [marine sediment metagenome]|uniref:Transposase DDE domain-containing protein n=1 Tax=marine sediment metagenome TaxID=412755 RepID=A0A0F9JRG9_9ZZZZ
MLQSMSYNRRGKGFETFSANLCSQSVLIYSKTRFIINSCKLPKRQVEGFRKLLKRLIIVSKTVLYRQLFNIKASITYNDQFN